MISSVRTKCGVCLGENLKEVVDMPKLPLTGIYVENPQTEKYKGIDQGLLICDDCGHAQLKNFLSPEIVYGDIYFHRTSGSPIARAGNDFFLEFLLKVVKNNKFKSILEIGCNDLYLLNRISDLGDQAVGVDPIWKHEPIPQTKEKLKIVGKFIEELNFETDVPVKPDLVISAHTFEHVESPRVALEYLINNSANNATVVIEVPGFDKLLVNQRFDQVFHQHIHYYSLASMSRMMNDLGCEYVDHAFNNRYWGGTMLMAFKKTGSKTLKDYQKFEKPNLDVVRMRFNQFIRQLESCQNLIESLKNEKIYAFGAAQMLPTISYHLKNDFSKFSGILDDNKDRWNLYYPYMNIKIRGVDDSVIPSESNVLLTALDSARPITKRLIDLGFKKILFPLNSIT